MHAYLVVINNASFRSFTLPLINVMRSGINVAYAITALPLWWTCPCLSTKHHLRSMLSAGMRTLLVLSVAQKCQKMLVIQTCENWIHPLSKPFLPAFWPTSPHVTPGINSPVFVLLSCTKNQCNPWALPSTTILHKVASQRHFCWTCRQTDTDQKLPAWVALCPAPPIHHLVAVVLGVWITNSWDVWLYVAVVSIPLKKELFWTDEPCLFHRLRSPLPMSQFCLFSKTIVLQ
jgi:hypothetical protein